MIATNGLAMEYTAVHGDGDTDGQILFISLMIESRLNKESHASNCKGPDKLTSIGSLQTFRILG
jgi:hypothetical protein